jgi:tetratricopeptide (TPR) repeat protein
MKTITLTASILITTTVSFAQTLQEAITKTDNERFAAAATDFRSLIAKEPSKGENYFYFGENYFRNGDLDSANIFYQKGADVNATYPLNNVGLGKVLWYKGKSAEAKTQFFKAATLGANKNAEVMRKTAEAYIDAETKSLDEAISLLNAAIKLDPKNAENYILMGDALLEKNPSDGGPAIKEYNKASDLNPKSPKGILRSGKLYQRARNYQLALDYYKKAETIDPNYAPAYREKAELYFLANQKANAIESYKKYLALNNDPEARKRYSGFLLSNKQYTEAIAEAEALQKNDTKDPYLYRYIGHSYAELGNKTDTAAYIKGLRSMEEFFKKAPADFKYSPLDYKYYGILLSKTGKDSLGIIQLEKAASMDPKIAGDIITSIAQAHLKAKRYAKAIEAYTKKLAGDKNNLQLQDWYDFGRSYYYEGGNKQKEKKDAEALQMFVQADTCFSILAQKSPDYAIAYFWRGKANVQQDLKNEKWLAKPFYEKGLELVKLQNALPANKSNVIEACEYLGYHSVTIKDYAKAKEYFGIIRDLDPNNKKQVDFFKSPQGK